MFRFYTLCKWSPALVQTNDYVLPLADCSGGLIISQKKNIWYHLDNVFPFVDKECRIVHPMFGLDLHRNLRMWIVYMNTIKGFGLLCLGADLRLYFGATLSLTTRE